MISTAITTVSDWLDSSDGASVDELTPGMHVVAHRIGYQHHGIYIGDGQVIAYLRDTGVTVCSWSTFADGDKVTVYEHDDALYSADKIVQRALDRVGEDDYNLVFNNCEHFANWCITGQAKSYQVREVAIETAALAAVAALAIRHAQTAVRVGSAAFSAVRALTAASAVGGGVAASAGAGATATATTAGAVSGAAAATGLAAVAVPVAAAAATVALPLPLPLELSCTKFCPTTRSRTLSAMPLIPSRALPARRLILLALSLQNPTISSATRRQRSAMNLVLWPQT